MLVENFIKSKSFYEIGKKTTVCLITTLDGFEVVGVSHCLNVNDFNSELGERFSYKEALKKLESFHAYYETINKNEGD